MGLSDLEPECDLRFVERSKGRDHKTPIEKFPCVIGHQGNIKPEILNGHISGKHCTVRYDLKSRSYIVEDGAEGKPSSNGIYFHGEKVDIATLKVSGDRLYLLRLISGEEGYLELFKPGNEGVCPRSTLDIDPRLIRTEETATEAHQIATKNAEHIEQLEGKLKQILIVYEVLTSNPKRTVTGIFLTFLILVLGTPFLVAWATRDAWTGVIIEQYKSHSRNK
jgi:hypothetical protein